MTRIILDLVFTAGAVGLIMWLFIFIIMEVKSEKRKKRLDAMKRNPGEDIIEWALRYAKSIPESEWTVAMMFEPNTTKSCFLGHLMRSFTEEPLRKDFHLFIGKQDKYDEFYEVITKIMEASYYYCTTGIITANDVCYKDFKTPKKRIVALLSDIIEKRKEFIHQ